MHKINHKSGGSIAVFEQDSYGDGPSTWSGLFEETGCYFVAKLDRYKYMNWCADSNLECLSVRSVADYVNYLIADETKIAKQRNWVPKVYSFFKK